MLRLLVGNPPIRSRLLVSSCGSRSFLIHEHSRRQHSRVTNQNNNNQHKKTRRRKIDGISKRAAVPSFYHATATLATKADEPLRKSLTQQVEQRQEPMDSRRLYRYLQLQTFSEEEIHAKFEEIRQCQVAINTTTTAGGPTATIPVTPEQFIAENGNQPENSSIKVENSSIGPAEISYFLERRIQHEEEMNEGLMSIYDKETTNEFRQEYAATLAAQFVQFFKNESSDDQQVQLKDEEGNHHVVTIQRDQFTSKLIDSASSVDFRRSWPITVSMLLVGSSVGVTIPAMPFVVQDLGLTAGEYGLVVSAFALAKMSGNIPSAVLVERHGRKPYLVYTLLVVACGVGGIGLATSFEHLYVCRLFTGLGVAGLSTAATMTLSDISTPLNRASTMAPIMSAFAAGTALGPALGGVLCDSIGIKPTFYLVGVSYFGLAALNMALLRETMAKPMHFPWQTESPTPQKEATIQESFETAVGQWVPLLSNPPVRNVCIMHGFYWIALAGAQMTLLPLILTDPDSLAMTATQVGQVYMGMSLVQVMGNPIFAKGVDTFGKIPGIVGGCTLIASSMATLPFCTDLYQMAGTLGVWAVGSSLLSTAPISFISDTVDGEKRAQAIALLRTSGDVGFLIGASSMGALADWAGSLGMAMQSSAGILLTATGWFAARQLINSKLSEKE